MRIPFGAASNRLKSIPILSVAPHDADHRLLEDAIDFRFALHRAPAARAALALLKRQAFPVLVCACDLEPGSWRDLLAAIQELPGSPSLIVTSRLADDCLWAEALNLGAHDVLAQPFDREEVARVIHAAWNDWVYRTRPLTATASRQV